MWPTACKNSGSDFCSPWNSVQSCLSFFCRLTVAILTLFCGSSPLEASRSCVDTIAWSFWRDSRATHIQGWSCPTICLNPWFQASQLLLVLWPPSMVASNTFHNSGGNSGATLLILNTGCSLPNAGGVWILL